MFGSIHQRPAAPGGGDVLLAFAAFQVGERAIHQQEVFVNDGLAPGPDLGLDDLEDARAKSTYLPGDAGG